MSIGLLTQSEVRAMLGERLKARTHWVFIVTPAHTHDLTEIEKRFYDGANADDFELFLLPLPGLPAIATGDKKRATPKQLARLLNRLTSIKISSDTLKERDILVLADEQTDALLISAVFNGWLSNPSSN